MWAELIDNGSFGGLLMSNRINKNNKEQLLNFFNQCKDIQIPVPVV